MKKNILKERLKMSPEVTLRKLSLLIQNIELLKKYKNADVKMVNLNHLEIERLLHLIIEIMGDVNYHLIVQKKARPPKSLYDSFIEIGEMGIIDLDLAKALAPSAGLRNALVHMYDDINIDFIIESIQRALELVPKYIQALQNWK